MLDSSSSSAAQKSAAIAFIRETAFALDPQIDRLTILRMSQDVYGLYSGKTRSRALTDALTAYSKVDPDETGTAYGLGIKRGLEEAAHATKAGMRPAIFILGDAADERVAGGGNVDWQVLSKQFDDFPKNGLLAFVFVEPRFGDRFETALRPVLQQRLRIVSTVTATDHAIISDVRRALGR